MMVVLAALVMAIHEMYPRWKQYRQVRSLAAEMRDPDPLISLPAAHALSKAGPLAVQRLVEALRDGDPPVRRRAAWVLGVIMPLPREAIPSLGAAIRDDDPEVRRRAADALGRFGPEAASQAAALRAALTDPDPNVRFGAARSLGRVERRDSDPVARTVLELLTVPVVPNLPEVDRGPRNPDRTAAAELVRGMGPEAQARAVAVLIPLVGAQDLAVRRAAIESLQSLGPAAAPAVPSLEQASRSDDLVTRCLASLTLAKIEGIERGRARATLQELLDGGALSPGMVPPRIVAEVRWVLTTNLVNGSEFSQPVHVLRSLAEELRRAEAQEGPITPRLLRVDRDLVQPEK